MLVGDPIHPEGVGPAGLSGSLSTQTILRLGAGAFRTALFAGWDSSHLEKNLVPILPLPPLPDDCRFCEVMPT